MNMEYRATEQYRGQERNWGAVPMTAPRIMEW